MANYFFNSHLLHADSEYEVYSFGVVENFYKILEQCPISKLQMDFDYNVITIESDDQNNRVFNINVNEIDCNRNSVEKSACLSLNSLIEIKRNKQKMVNLGSVKNERIIVKDNYCNETKIERAKATFSLKRKHSNSCLDESDQIRGVKKMSLEIDSSDELGSRSKTQPKVRSSFSLKKKVDVLNQLKLGKSIHEVSDHFRISEKMIREFQRLEDRIREQFEENLKEADAFESQQNYANFIEKTDMYRDSFSQSVKSESQKTDSEQDSKIARKLNDDNNTYVESLKCVLKLNFEIHEENGKLVFGNNVREKNAHSSIFSLELPKTHPDIPKPPSVTAAKVNVTKQVLSKSSSNLIPKVKPNTEVLTKKPAQKPVSKSSETYQKTVKNESKIIEPGSIPLDTLSSKSDVSSSVQQSIKTVPSQIRNNVKLESKLTLKKKSSTSHKSEPPKKLQSPFRYLIIDPSEVDFKPEENIDSEIRSSSVIDSQEFINEIRQSYDRYTTCLQLYEKFKDKREELANRARATKTEQEISELYKEFYRLLEEEKLPFFVALEREVMTLHDKLSKAADLMGIKLT